MENSELEKSNGSEDTSQLARNRSFKSKQLVRSRAIRESQSPPRTASPSVTADEPEVASAVTVTAEDGDAPNALSSQSGSEECGEECRKQQPVEIQITTGAWEEPGTDQRLRTKRWLGMRQQSRDLLSYSPRVACVCGACHACPHCRGRRRKNAPAKQDSGIVCSEDCPDCSDCESKTSLEVDNHSGYCRCPERKEKPKNISLSRTDSDDKSEPTGQELVNFLKETLNKNGRDRMTLLRIEKELHALVNDPGRCIVKFPVMTSYGRLLVHRVASLFQLSHRLDQSNKNAVLVSKSGTSGGRIPCTSFKQWCTVNFPPSPQRHQADAPHAKSILKRDAHSLDEPGGGALSAARSKSLEQREREYERVRRRIFSTDNCSQDESQWQWLNNGPVKVLTADTGRNKLLKVQSLEGSPGACPGSSTSRGPVSKSHSFGGYQRQPTTETPRLLSRQGDLASSSWRLSPSSSGYRTLSLHSTDSVTPSPTGGASPEPTSGEGVTVVWAVTNLSSVPPGALVIHPQTGRPLTNPDGSVYHFDPTNPPVLPDAAVYNQGEQKTDINSDKKRGRLEKQHSFIDNESESGSNEECRSKCCQCRRRETCPCQAHHGDKAAAQTDQKPEQQPQSPCKNNFELPAEPATNHSAAADPPANSRPAYEPPTNEKPAAQISTNQRSFDVSQTTDSTPTYSPHTTTNQHFEIPRTYELANQKTGFETQRPPSFESANQKTAFENKRPPSFESANQKTVYENQRPPSFESANQKTVYENQRPPSFESANQKTGFENQRLPSYELANQRASSDLASSRPVKFTNQSTPEVQYIGQQYQVYSHEEVTTPPQAMPAYIQADMGAQAIAQVKPMQITDPNIRPMSLGVVYPSVPQYQYSLPVYQPVHTEEQKTLAPSPHTDNTFRIDPSYPYAPVDYASCSACAEPQPPRPYALYTPVQYQPHQPVTYPDQLQWQNIQPLVPIQGAQQPKLYVPDIYPIMQYPTVYPQYNVMYPQQQVLQPAYGVIPPVYAAADRRPTTAPAQRLSKRNSFSGSSRTTPLQTPPDDKKVPYDHPPPIPQTHPHIPQNPTQSRSVPHNPHVHNPQRQDNNEIAATIQHIKAQMAQMNTSERGDTRERDKNPRNDWKRRNSGNGILGSYPVNNFNGRFMGRPQNDETQLSSAARAIVNSIRNMQAKSYYDRRPDQSRGDNREYRRRTDGGDKPDRTDARGVPYRPDYLLRQMSPGTWCRRSPGPIHPVFNQPRRPHPDSRNNRR